MNNFDLCLEVVSRLIVMSTIASHSPLNISETVSDRGLVPKDTDRKLPTGNHVTDDVT